MCYAFTIYFQQIPNLPCSQTYSFSQQGKQSQSEIMDGNKCWQEQLKRSMAFQFRASVLNTDTAVVMRASTILCKTTHLLARPIPSHPKAAENCPAN